MPTTRVYRNGVVAAENFPVQDVSEYLEDDAALVWVDLCSPDTSDLRLIASELGLHELAVEDAIDAHQRPKLDHYTTHNFLNAYDVRLDTTSGDLATSEVAAFITDRAFVTVRKDDTFDMAAVVARWDASADLVKHGVGALLYGLLDHLVDGHFETVQTLDDEIEKLEDLVFDDRPHDAAVQRRSYRLRKSLVRLRRVILPMREVVNALMRPELGVVPEPLYPYYQDVYDHVLRATEWTESLRDLVTTILETNLTIQGNRLNIITKKVTSWAAIIAVPTAITGFYGQNVPYPGFGKEWGFITSCLIMLGVSTSLYWAFKRKDWL